MVIATSSPPRTYYYRKPSLAVLDLLECLRRGRAESATGLITYRKLLLTVLDLLKGLRAAGPRPPPDLLLIVNIPWPFWTYWKVYARPGPGRRQTYYLS